MRPKRKQHRKRGPFGMAIRWVGDRRYGLDMRAYRSIVAADKYAAKLKSKAWQRGRRAREA